jgi:hypothetical protein
VVFAGNSVFDFSESLTESNHQRALYVLQKSLPDKPERKIPERFSRSRPNCSHPARPLVLDAQGALENGAESHQHFKKSKWLFERSVPLGGRD